MRKKYIERSLYMWPNSFRNNCWAHPQGAEGQQSHRKEQTCITQTRGPRKGEFWNLGKATGALGYVPSRWCRHFRRSDAGVRSFPDIKPTVSFLLLQYTQHPPHHRGSKPRKSGRGVPPGTKSWGWGEPGKNLKPGKWEEGTHINEANESNRYNPIKICLRWNLSTIDIVELFYTVDVGELFYTIDVGELFYTVDIVELFFKIDIVELFYKIDVVGLIYTIDIVELF